MSAQLRAGPVRSVGGAVAGRARVSGGLAFALLLAVLCGARLPFISTDRDAFFVLLGLGWLGCMAGAGSTIEELGWRHPVCLGGMALGLVALAMVGLVLTSTTAPFTWLAAAVTGSGSIVPPERVAFVGLGVVLMVKWALGLAGRARLTRS